MFHGWIWGCEVIKQKKIFFKDFIYLFLERREGREKEKERNINVWLPLMWPPLGTWPTTQAKALNGNWTSKPQWTERQPARAQKMIFDRKILRSSFVLNIGLHAWQKRKAKKHFQVFFYFPSGNDFNQGCPNLASLCHTGRRRVSWATH